MSEHCGLSSSYLLLKILKIKSKNVSALHMEKLMHLTLKLYIGCLFENCLP